MVVRCCGRGHTFRVTSHATPTARRTWLAPSIGWGAFVVGAVAIGTLARSPFANVAGPRMLPRVPGPPPDLGTLLFQLGVGSVIWYASVIALPLLVLIARRIDIDKLGRARTIALILAVVACDTLISQFIDYRVTYGDQGPPFSAWFFASLRQHLPAWLAVVGLAAALEWRRRAAQGAIERERLRTQVAEQRLIALTGQLHPHFLFNTLQGISTLIHRDADAADEMLAQLSDLLRDLLRHRDRMLVPLAEELRFARTYLELSQRRFPDRLTFSIDAPADTLALDVPLFILQPLIENAITHGIGGQMAGGSITVRARHDGSSLVLQVVDDGAGLAAGALRDGVGLANTRERLRATYGDAQRFTLESHQPSGAVARVVIPARATTQ